MVLIALTFWGSDAYYDRDHQLREDHFGNNILQSAGTEQRRMASAENVVALYMVAVDSDPEEEKASIDELSRRIIHLHTAKLMEGIQSRELKLLDFVRILGEHLTHEDSTHRKHGNRNNVLAD